MRWAGAMWRPLDTNYVIGGMSTVNGLVLHIMEGSLDGTDAWFRHPTTQASAHFGVGLDGRVYQWVDTADEAWAEVAGNNTYVSVEIEGYLGDVPNLAQYASLVSLIRWMHVAHGMPYVLAEKPGDRGLGFHAMGGVAWGNHPCPGPRIVEARQRMLDAAQKGGTKPMYDPPIGPFCSMREWVDGGWMGLGLDGSTYAFGCPPMNGANGQSYFIGRIAADFVHGPDSKIIRNSLGGPSILATSGERYDLAPRK